MASVSILEKISAALMAKKPAETIIRKLPAADLDDSVVILFTGGSEKEPKAVQLTHKNIGANLEAIIKTFKLTHDDVLFSMLPLFHVFGYTVDNWLPLVTGMTNITYANPLEYKKIPELVRMEKPTMIAGTPIFFGGYLRESKKGDFCQPADYHCRCRQNSGLASQGIYGTARSAITGRIWNNRDKPGHFRQYQ
jgi:acyl-[acyl-carrier-protein]-phospholipid O-acyltransferase/long-chain-fatty-acid--[acyl-carrier-protein] ligase